jgi:sugar lactone lactonase YvrE
LNFRVNADGTTDLPEPFYDFWVADSADASGAAGICMDRDGRAFAATPMGVQIFDRNGRLMAILPLPGNAAATSICFGGSDFGTLYAASDGKIFQRKLRHVGAPPWGAPIKLPHWGEG